MERITAFIRSRSSLENPTRFHTKIGKVYTRFQTKTGKNPTRWGARTYMAYIREYPPLGGGGGIAIIPQWTGSEP